MTFWRKKQTELYLYILHIKHIPSLLLKNGQLMLNNTEINLFLSIKIKDIRLVGVTKNSLLINIK